MLSNIVARSVSIGLAAFVASVVFPGRAVSQTLFAECGGFEQSRAQHYLDGYLKIFVAADFYADFRQQFGITTLPPGVTRSVLNDKNTCRNVMREALSAYNDQIAPGAGATSESFDFVILQYSSSYYVVSLQPKDAAAAEFRGPTEVLILRVNPLAFITWAFG